MKDSEIIHAYEAAKERYAALGVDTNSTSFSHHCIRQFWSVEFIRANQESERLERGFKNDCHRINYRISHFDFFACISEPVKSYSKNE